MQTRKREEIGCHDSPNGLFLTSRQRWVDQAIDSGIVSRALQRKEISMIRLNANPLKKGHRLVSLALFAIGLIASTVAALAAGGARAGGSGTWAKTGSLTTARDFHTATLLQKGEGLLAGGNCVKGRVFSSPAVGSPDST